MKNKLQSSKPLRFIVNFNDGDQENFVSYDCSLDPLNQSPYLSSYSYAIHAACSRHGTVYAEFLVSDPSDPNRFKKIKDYNK